MLDTVLPLTTGPHPATGVFFARQTVDDLIDAVRRFEAVEERFDPAFLRSHAETFDRPHFRRKLETFLRSLRAEPMEPLWPTRPALA